MTTLFMVASMLLLLAATASAQSSGADILDVGIVFSGPVTFQREDAMTTFILRDGSVTVGVNAATARAFPATPNNTMSFLWAQKLVGARSASIRFADLRNLPAGTQLRADLLDLLTCFIEPTKRTDSEMLYHLKCVADDAARRPPVKPGDSTRSELDIGVWVPNHSQAEAFFARPREGNLLFVRLE